MRIVLTLVALVLIPQQVFALTLQERVNLRRQQRIEQSQNITPNQVRVGRTIQTAPSIRRLSTSNEGVVTRVVDGSVLLVEMANGRTVQVRTLGAEAPLITTGSSKDQCYAEQSRQALEKLLLGKQVRLDRDRNYQYDNERRLLRYVYRNSLDVNSYMLSNGFSFADDKNTHRKSTLYKTLEQEARDDDKGLWNDFCTYNPNPSRVIEILE